MSERIKLWRENERAAFVIRSSPGALFFFYKIPIFCSGTSKNILFNDFETFDIIEDFGNIKDVGARVSCEYCSSKLAINTVLSVATKIKLFGPVSRWDNCSLFIRNLLSL